MLRIKQILCPVDFFPASTRAAEYAIGLARTFGSRVILLHVVEPVGAMPSEVPLDLDELIEVMTASAAEMLGHMAKRAEAKNVSVDVVIRTGLVDDEIQTLIKTRPVDLVVMGTHGRSGLGRVLIGSTVKRLLRRLHLPLLTLDAARRVQAAAIRRILVATDLSEGTQEAVDYAVSLSQQFNAALTLFHVVSELHADLAGIYRVPLLRSIEDHLKNLLPVNARNSADVNLRVEVGRPALRIRTLLKREPMDLVVMNVHGKTVLDRLTVGRTAEKLINRPGIPPILWVGRGSARLANRRASAKAAA